MPISEEERKFLNYLEKLIGLSIPEVSELQSYTFGFTAKDNHVEGLSLFSCGLTIIPEKITTLTRLNKILLRGNKLKVIPEELCFISSLETLDLSENRLVKLPKAIYTLSSLKELHLETNRLTILPDTISSLTNLTLLDLSENSLYKYLIL
ncbi:unnamed protein product [marine sediment metagenome]|uniref:Leucine-rich repeat domain-containing protein n=1 Tax=marine sediment metagenome TaxID=412755 RepID=X1C5Y9_9ZZZZ